MGGLHGLVRGGLVAGGRGLLPLGGGELLFGRGLVRLRLFGGLVRGGGLGLRVGGRPVRGIGLGLGLRGLLRGGINLLPRLVRIVLVLRGLLGGLVLRVLRGGLLLLGGGLIRLRLLHGPVRIVDRVGGGAGGLLGGRDLVRGVGRVLGGLLLLRGGLLLVLLRLLLGRIGGLLLGGGVVEILLGRVQCAGRGVRLGLRLGHAGWGGLLDGLIGFLRALLRLPDALLRLADGLTGLIVRDRRRLVGHGDGGRGHGGHGRRRGDRDLREFP